MSQFDQIINDLARVMNGSETELIQRQIQQPDETSCELRSSRESDP